MVVTSSWGQGEMGSYFIMDREFPSCKMKRPLEMDCGIGCTTK